MLFELTVGFVNEFKVLGVLGTSLNKARRKCASCRLAKQLKLGSKCVQLRGSMDCLSVGEWVLHVQNATPTSFLCNDAEKIDMLNCWTYGPTRI